MEKYYRVTERFVSGKDQLAAAHLAAGLPRYCAIYLENMVFADQASEDRALATGDLSELRALAHSIRIVYPGDQAAFEAACARCGLTLEEIIPPTAQPSPRKPIVYNQTAMAL